MNRPDVPQDAPPVGPARILLVDDDRDLVDILRFVLERAGHTVLAAHDAGDGFRLAQEQHPDLLILDVMMPEGTEGFHLVWKLRAQADDWSRSVPIIMLTAVHQRTPLRFYPDASDGHYAPGQYLEVTDFLDKPVEPGALVHTVERVLRMASPGPQLAV